MTMENLLFLAGAGFFALCTLIYWSAAFKASKGWGMAGLLIPPSAIFFYAVFWSRRRTLALVHFTSLLMLILACVVWVRANPQWFQGSQLVVVRDWLAPAFASKPLIVRPQNFASEPEMAPFLQRNMGNASGRLDSDAVEFVRATFINGVLRFKSDETAYSPLEVSIPLQSYSLRPGENLLQYTPESLDNPPVLISRRQEPGLRPEVEMVERGFWLELMLTTNSDLVYSGYVKLRLPDSKRSFVAGEFRAYTRDLRLSDDQIDRQFDSNATIEYVVEQYLINTLGNKLDRIGRFRNTFYQAALDDASGRTEVDVRLVDGTEKVVHFGLIKGSEGWVVKTAPELDLMAALGTLRQNPPAAIGRVSTRDRLISVGP
ncbi:MAG TPA: hypothetical protein VM553_23420, partial [Dongiaceae bacterium]|nr:hypothetical protein [Dongiaceae bacterium]